MPATDNNQPVSRLARKVAQVERFPRFLQAWLLNFAIHRAIPYTGTSRVELMEVDGRHCRMRIRSHHRVHNHIQTIHAAAAALLAESASGLAFGWHLPDDKLPLLKRMNIRYVSLLEGDLEATASVDVADRQRMQQDERGDTVVSVVLTDSAG
ncbi:MAG: DUF4442 domain-containing protein, partial [Gammaproteobacteria bacterium]|nr:DUF4442 domain-containing protein [Gammaproteobacteria bacterium]